MADGTGGFHAATGDEGPSAPAGRRPDERADAVRQAMDGLHRIRAVMNPPAGRPLSVPADWERLQPVRAVALALEAAGVPPSAVGTDGRRLATGYRVHADGGTVRVEWVGPPGSRVRYQQQEGLRRCADVLRGLGWQALEYRGARGLRWLEVEPP
ncbi:MULTISPECIES: hypothetical protein [Streptomyces]|uniref:hypothetical protein n=1 Tax=Streptomyces TaxID=1883 RepID=UPI00163CE377|nr:MULTISPECIES: hypothetical protein [Streptomyces]MBC2876450.1 hypothetical protein [Streptomyces sp. TYQ1024]UBI40877.1 hypothetical protein K7I03_33365 [Streptomyces mobaraensis]